MNTAIGAPRKTPVATIQDLTWWVPLLLFIGGWITYLFDGSSTAFDIGTVIANVALARSLYLLIFRCQDVRFTWITGCGLLLGYGLGTLNTVIQVARRHQTLAEHVLRPQEDLSFALALVMWTSAVLFLAGSMLERPVRLNFARLLKTDVTYLVLSLVIYVGALATHQIGYMGSSVSDTGHVSIVGTIASLIGPTLPAITVIVRRKSKWLPRPVVFWALLPFELIMQVPAGRRILIYSSFVVVFAFTLAGDRWKSALWKKALILSVVGVGLYGGNVFFFAMRHEVDVSGAGRKLGAPDMQLDEMVTRAIKFIREGRDDSFDERMAENLQDRTLVLKYFSDLVAQSHTHTPTHGKILQFALSMATPSVIYSKFGDKDAIIALGMEETVADPDFGLEVHDEANSLLTGGVCDFGIPGVFLYPLLLALLINLLIRTFLGRAPELMRVIAVMMFAVLLFQTELSVTGVMVQMRNTALLLLCWIPVSLVVRFFFKASDQTSKRADSLPAVTSDAILVRYEVVSEGR